MSIFEDLRATMATLGPPPPPLRFIVDENATSVMRQHRKPKSRSRRIRKKWAGRPQNWQKKWQVFKAMLPDMLTGRITETWFLPPHVYHRLRAERPELFNEEPHLTRRAILPR